MSKAPREFTSVEAESDFWDEQDLTDWMVGPQLRITTTQRAKGILPVRLSPAAVKRIRALAREQRVGISTLLSSWIEERLEQQTAP